MCVYIYIHIQLNQLYMCVYIYIHIQLNRLPRAHSSYLSLGYVIYTYIYIYIYFLLTRIISIALKEPYKGRLSGVRAKYIYIYVFA